MFFIDDSTHAKPKGKKMEGLGRHYSTSEGKPVKGHSLIGVWSWTEFTSASATVSCQGKLTNSWLPK